jgi:hypothetical protein
MRKEHMAAAGYGSSGEKLIAKMVWFCWGPFTAPVISIDVLSWQLSTSHREAASVP